MVHTEFPYEWFWGCWELNEATVVRRMVHNGEGEYISNIAAANQGPALKEKENGAEGMVNNWALSCPN